MSGFIEVDNPHVRQQIIEGDCLTVMRGMDASTINVMVTSPPYNIGKQYSHFADDQPRGQYLAWLGDIADQLHRLLTDDGALFLNVGATNADPWVAQDVAQVFRHRFVLQNHIVWVKSIALGADTLGHFKPINSRRFLNHTHEAILHFTKQGNVPINRLAVGVPFKDKSNIARRGHAQDRRCAGNVWFIPYATAQSRQDKYHHPAGFPTELPLRCLRLHGGDDLRVLDPFMGTGTTLLAAQALGHCGLGIEIDPAYIQVARTRLGL